jgi:hypothetical protein
MKINPNNSTSHLRLVRPPAPPATPTAPATQQPTPTQPSDKTGDVFIPQTLHTNPPLPLEPTGPKSPVLSKQLLEARQRLEAIRAQLVAAKTNRPMNFDDTSSPASTPQISPLNANSGVNQYLRLAGTSADANENATQRTANEGDTPQA